MHTRQNERLVQTESGSAIQCNSMQCTAEECNVIECTMRTLYSLSATLIINLHKEEVQLRRQQRSLLPFSMNPAYFTYVVAFHHFFVVFHNFFVAIYHYIVLLHHLVLITNSLLFMMILADQAVY